MYVLSDHGPISHLVGGLFCHIYFRDFVFQSEMQETKCMTLFIPSRLSSLGTAGLRQDHPHHQAAAALVIGICSHGNIHCSSSSIDGIMTDICLL